MNFGSFFKKLVGIKTNDSSAAVEKKRSPALIANSVLAKAIQNTLPAPEYDITLTAQYPREALERNQETSSAFYTNNFVSQDRIDFIEREIMDKRLSLTDDKPDHLKIRLQYIERILEVCKITDRDELAYISDRLAEKSEIIREAYGQNGRAEYKFSDISVQFNKAAKMVQDYSKRSVFGSGNLSRDQQSLENRAG